MYLLERKLSSLIKKKNIDKNDLYSASLASVPFVKKKNPWSILWYRPTFFMI